MRSSTIAAGAACLALSPLAHAQVNVEPLRKEVAERGFSAKLSGTLSGSAGNTPGVTAGSSALVGVAGGPHLAYFAASGDYSRVNQTTLVAKSFAHLRYNYQLSHPLWAEAFTQIETDRFRRIRDRELLGAGPRFGVVQSDQVGLFYGTAAMLERTILNADIVGSDTRQTVVRWSNYVAFRYDPDDRVQLTNTTYIQPRFDRFRDYHVLSQLALGFTIARHLGSSILATLRYESVVPDGVKRADLEIKDSLDLRF